jgi:ankyrin repeat protein
VQALLATGKVDPFAGDNSPLREASSNGHLEVVRLLLSLPNFDLTNPTVSASLIDASKNGHVDIVRFFLTNISLEPNYDFMVNHICDFPIVVVELIFEAGKTNPIIKVST